jgi:hypothetical protein
MLVEIHVLQNHSPSNPNRDDLGAPKTAMFGGVLRARISSQCLKRSIRTSPLFREMLPERIGMRTRLFPYLVGEALKNSELIPPEEHRSIVIACQRIATDKEASSTEASAKADPRPKTPQLIFLGPGHATEFVRRLERLREDPDMEAEYAYFLNPIVGFQELVRDRLQDVPLDEKQREKIVKAAWWIAKTRLATLPQATADDNANTEPEEADAITELTPEPAAEAGEPTLELAELIAARMADVCTNDPDAFKALTKRPTTDEKKRLGADAPAKPRNMTRFLDELAAANQHDAVDIGLFGRMTTSDAFENVEAAMEVAHAISTNQLQPEVDYFTAVDDLDPLGAGHIGENQFNSSTFYKYFSLDWDALVLYLAGNAPTAEQLAADSALIAQWESRRQAAMRLAADAVAAFLRAAAFAVPSGKKKGHANNNLPDGILVELKAQHIPTNYANAFLAPARHQIDPDGRTTDVMADSIRKLAHYVGTVVQGYGIAAERWWFTTRHDTPFRCHQDDEQAGWEPAAVDNLDGLIQQLCSQLLVPVEGS